MSKSKEECLQILKKWYDQNLSNTKEIEQILSREGKIIDGIKFFTTWNFSHSVINASFNNGTNGIIIYDFRNGETFKESFDEFNSTMKSMKGGKRRSKKKVSKKKVSKKRESKKVSKTMKGGKKLSRKVSKKRVSKKRNVKK